MSISLASELESSLIGFAGSGSTSARLQPPNVRTVMGIPADKMARGWGGIIGGKRLFKYFRQRGRLFAIEEGD